MNKKNKIVLSLILGVAMNQAFGEEGQQNEKAAGAKTVVENKDTKALAKEALEKAETELKKVVDTRKQNQDEIETLKAKLAKDGLDAGAIAKHEEMIAKIEAGKKIDVAFEAATKAKDEAWKNAHTIKAAALKWATGVVLGGFLIEQFSLTGNIAKLAKYGSAATVAGVCAIAAYKGYNYLFTEEINDDEEIF